MIIFFKVFEKWFESNDDNYETIAINDCYWSFDYDSYQSKAKILLDKNDSSLYLKIKKVHIKSGLGAGTFPVNDEFIKFGNLIKPDLVLVRTKLKEYACGDNKFNKFSMFWQDDEGNKFTLTDLIKMKKSEMPKIENIENTKKLSHIKSKKNFEKNDKIELVKYSDKSYALFGEGTKEIKDDLLSLGCRYNKFLTDPSTGLKRPGWILSIGKLDKVKQLIFK